MVARRNVRKLIIALGEIQDRVGVAKNLFADDRSPGAYEKAQNLLEQAFNICVQARSTYDPVDAKTNRPKREMN